MYTKYGQIGAGLTNTFSKVWIEKLRKLEDRVEPQPASIVLRTIAEDLGRPPDEIFAEFDEVPLGSASIGQVHRAKLHSGEEVAVKVQYPTSERLFKTDMKTIRGFLETFAPEQAIMLDELERSLEGEFNYVEEAKNLVEVGQNMVDAGFAAEVYVPQPVGAMTTRRVLFMELLQGPKLKDGLSGYAKILAAENGMTLEEFEAAETERIEQEGAGPYTGPTATTMQAYLQAARTWDSVRNVGVWGYNAVYGNLSGAPMAWYETVLPPNTPRIMEALMRVHGHQLLVNGFFNADPHAGNFLLLPDGRIGLIDYGATKRLSNSDRLVACVLYAALRRRDTAMIRNVCLNGGYKSKHSNEEVMMKLMRFGFDTYGKDLLEGKNVQQFMDDLYATDPWEEGADNLIMANFLSIRLRSVGLQMAHPVVCSDYWGAKAEEVLAAEGMPYDDWDREYLAKVAPPESMSIAKGVN